MQFFTVATAPYEDIQLRQHQPQRVPASTSSSSTSLSDGDGGGEGRDNVIVLSWNVKELAREGADYDRAALVLADADIVVLREVDVASRGKGFLNIMGGLIEAKVRQKFCRAWVTSSDGSRLRYGFMWRESLIGYLEPNGVMHDSCDSKPFTIRQSKRLHNGAYASFYTKNPRKLFELAVVQFDKKPRTATDVNDLFRNLNDKQWPVLVAADYKTGAMDPVFRDLIKNGFQSALDSSKRGGRKSFENFWFRNAALTSSGTVNLYQRFSDSRPQDIEKGLSDQFPIAIELSTTEELNPKMTSVLVAKEKPALKKVEAKLKKKKPKVEKEESLEDEESNISRNPIGE